MKIEPEIMNRQSKLHDSESNLTRICVIGAGPSGLMTLRALQSLSHPGAKGEGRSGAGGDSQIEGEMERGGKFQVVCYERHEQVGGMWNFR